MRTMTGSMDLERVIGPAGQRRFLPGTGDRTARNLEARHVNDAGRNDLAVQLQNHALVLGSGLGGHFTRNDSENHAASRNRKNRGRHREDR
jgi:hypothetical protein